MFDSRFIDEYSKKILSFAYDKTGNIYDAEDLSQEILIALFISIPKYSKIENMDGFIYTVCYYCWANFCRRNKNYRRSANIDDMDIPDDADVQNEVETAIFIKKMRKEIAYLSKLHRDIITMTYYDGKSSAQISSELNISASTIRWHLVEIRKKLKGRIEMNNENLNYTPVELYAGWSGKSCNNMAGIGTYRLVDNILYVCYGKPLNIEEIAQKLSVAAAFIEMHIKELVYLDYMKVVDGDKYQTAVFIRTKAYLEAGAKYKYENIINISGKVYETVEKRFDDIKAINFIGSDLDKDFLLWIFMPLLIQRSEYKSHEIINKKKEYFCCMPKRKDGSEHWIRAFLKENGYISPLPEEVKEFEKKSGLKSSNACEPNEINSYQIIPYSTQQVCGDRPFLSGRDLKEISHIVEIIKNNYVQDGYDKTLIARYAEMGYAKVDGDKVKLMIPYLSGKEYEKLNKILLEAEAELGDDFFVDFIEGSIKSLKVQVPDFLPENEKNYVLKDFGHCGLSIPYYLADHGKLRYPTDEEARRLGVIIWEV